MRTRLIKPNITKQLFFAVIGTFIAAVGIRLIVVSGLGADAISTLVLGILQHVPLKFGTVSMLFNGIILVMVFFYDRKMIGIGSIINSFGIGFYNSGWNELLGNHHWFSRIWFRHWYLFVSGFRVGGL